MELIFRLHAILKVFVFLYDFAFDYLIPFFNNNHPLFHLFLHLCSENHIDLRK